MKTKAKAKKSVWSHLDPHAVYRIYATHDVVLYIGMTHNLRTRLSCHKCLQKDRWWPMVQRYEVDWYPNQHDAKIAEARELRIHRPLCNKAFPDESGRHTTVTKGRIPVRSLWDLAEDMAIEDGITVFELIERLLEVEARRLRREMERSHGKEASS